MDVEGFVNPMPISHRTSIIAKIDHVGVVTVTYNAASFLPGFMKSCAAQTHSSFTIYCHDNLSTDGTQAALAEFNDPFLQLTLNGSNLGYAAANNHAIRQALHDGCEWILLLNNDTTFHPTLFAGLIAAARQSKWSAVVPKVLFDQPTDHLWFAGGHFNRLKGHTGAHVGYGELDQGQHDSSCRIDFAPMCCMLIHRSVFDAVGLLDEAFFVYYEDTDYCWRMREHRIALGYWPHESLVHLVGGSTGGIDSPFTSFMAARNRLFFIKKHLGAASAMGWSVVFVPYYVVRHLLKRWNPASFAASIRGTFTYASMRSSIPPLHSQSASQRSDALSC